jgi:hypothetical protein
MQDSIVRAHSDLYVRHLSGTPTVKLSAGRIEVGSAVDAPFGVAAEISFGECTPLEKWRFDSLQHT